MESVQARVKSALALQDASALFGALGWDCADVPIAGPGWLAWSGAEHATEARLVARAPGCRVLGVHSAVNRELVLTVHRRSPLETVLWVFFSGGAATVVVAAGGRLRSMTLECAHPDPMGLDQLLQLVPGALTHPSMRDPAEAAAAQLQEILSQEELTRTFFRDFAAALGELTRTVLSGPPDEEDRWQASLIVLLRLIFVYFLQRDGLLDGDRRYVVRRLRADRAHFFDRVLRPLFFGVLNTAASDRDAAAAALGDIPFLNGGLFEPTAVELAHPDMRWPADTLGAVIENLFERFHFTAVEPSGEDEARVVDPQMLGKVFEGLMYGDRRRKAGAFYTPRDVVRAMVDENLDAYVADRASEGRSEAEALQTVRILDPAVGTGAFLLEAFASLKSRRRAVGLPADYDAMRDVVHEHLFGVDRDPTAVRLCELRLWLALLAVAREGDGSVGPLPNLGHRIVAGDSLLDGVDLAQHRAGGLHGVSTKRVQELEEELGEAQRRYLTAHGPAKVLARQEAETVERELQVALIEMQRASIRSRSAPLRAVADSRDLFGEPVATAAQTAALERYERELDALAREGAAVARGEAVAPGFGYPTRFGAAGREGFDLIVTNPPWVRAHRVDERRRRILHARYATAAGGLWPGAERAGIRAPYGTQTDLAAMFVERSLELLRPGGRLAALIPAKLFRGLHGSALRRLLHRHTIESIEDLSDARRRIFEATVYPAIIRVRKEAPDDAPIDVRVWRRDRCQRFSRRPADLSLSGAPGEPWCVVPDEVDAILRRVRMRCTLLGEAPDCMPRRGVFTGANDVFLRPRGGFEAELGPEVREFVRPVATGSGLGAAPVQEILWCYEGPRPRERVPASIAAYFERHAAQLAARADHDPRGPLWQLFRVREDAEVAKVAWRDIAMHLDAVPLEPGRIALNTVYYVPFEHAEEAAGFTRWMGSLPVRASAYALAERARGGWRRHFAWVVQMLPVPAFGSAWREFDPRAFALSRADEQVLRRWLDLEARQEAA